MSRTFQAVCDRARVPLNDAGKTRYTDVDLLAYANDAILILRRKRPDLFVGSFLTFPAGEYTLGQSVPVGDENFPAICDYVTARAEFRDDEAAMQERAQSFFSLFSGAL